MDRDTYITMRAKHWKGRRRGGADFARDVSIAEGDDDSTWEGGFLATPWVRSLLWWLKFFLMLICWFIFTLLLMGQHEVVKTPTLVCVPAGGSLELPLKPPVGNEIGLTLNGAFQPSPYNGDHQHSTTSPTLLIIVEMVTPPAEGAAPSALPEKKNVSAPWILTMVPLNEFDTAELQERTKNLDLSERPATDNSSSYLQLRFTSTEDAAIPLQILYDTMPMPTMWSVIYASAILFLLYFLLFSHLVHRTMAALITSTLAISILALLQDRPTMPIIVSWFDVEMIIMLFSMYIVVSIFADTGILDFLAVRSYEMANGHIWPILNCMCLIAIVGSALLDNIPLMLIMSPITIRLSEVIQVNPVPVLTAIILWCNVGSALTPFGDQPAVAIADNRFVKDDGVDYFVFVVHMLPGVMLALLQTYLHLRIKYYNSNKMRFTEANEVERLRHIIKLWKHTAKSVPIQSKGEKAMRDTVMTKVHGLRKRMRRLGKMPIPPSDFEETLRILKAHYPIRNKPLLIKCFVTLAFIVIFFGLFIFNRQLSAGWVALLGAMLLLIVADIEDLEGVLARIDWSTMMFIAAFYVLTKAIVKMGVIDFISEWTERTTLSAPEDKRLTVAIVMIIWVSALSSAVLDNLTVALIMLRMTFHIAEKDALNLPLHPLLWALTYGTCFGANGTITGALCNMVTSGLAERHGYSFTFQAFFRIGFPIMIGNLIMATCYLLVAHVVFEWH